MRTVILATTNPHKVREVRDRLLVPIAGEVTP